jgi:hypothetical protein
MVPDNKCWKYKFKEIRDHQFLRDMPFNYSLYLKSYYYSFFKSKDTPGRLSAKRLFLLLFLFFTYPIWNLYIRFGFSLDKIIYPDYQVRNHSDPVFIVGNYRSGSTFFHRLLLRDPRFTCLQAWEIYFAPGLCHRKLLRFILRLSKGIGSPVQRFIRWFDRSLNEIYPMHKTGMYTYEQDSQLFYHVWSSYNLFAIFPFPELIRQFIYYDQDVPNTRRVKDFSYYRGVLKRHLYLHPGRQYLSKNPDFSPAVQTLLEYFPQAKFINLVRPPEKMVPSLINLWASNWKAYGSPEEPYPLIDTLLEQGHHWYRYPHTILSDLPPDRYQAVDFNLLVQDPKRVIERIYDHFGFDLTQEYRAILEDETLTARNNSPNNHYPLGKMGLDEEDLRKRFSRDIARYQFQESTPERISVPK